MFGASTWIGGIDDIPARLRGLVTLTCRLSSRHWRWIFFVLTSHAVARRHPNTPHPAIALAGWTPPRPKSLTTLRTGEELERAHLRAIDERRQLRRQGWGGYGVKTGVTSM